MHHDDRRSSFDSERHDQNQRQWQGNQGLSSYSSSQFGDPYSAGEARRQDTSFSSGQYGQTWSQPYSSGAFGSGQGYGQRPMGTQRYGYPSEGSSGSFDPHTSSHFSSGSIGSQQQGQGGAYGGSSTYGPQQYGPQSYGQGSNPGWSGGFGAHPYGQGYAGQASHGSTPGYSSGQSPWSSQSGQWQPGGWHTPESSPWSGSSYWSPGRSSGSTGGGYAGGGYAQGPGAPAWPGASSYGFGERQQGSSESPWQTNPSGYGQSPMGQSGYGYQPSRYGVSSWIGGMGAGTMGGWTAGRQSDMRSRRGPKGYQRSDDRLREEVIDKLLQQSDMDLDQIEIAVTGGDVSLSGSVDSRRTKHLIEDIIDSVWGVKEITNNLRVSSAWSGAGSGERGTSNTARGPFAQPDESSRSRIGSSENTSSSSSSGGGSPKSR